jgi:MFS family permease
VIVLASIRFLHTFFWGMAIVLIPLLLRGASASKTAIAVYATVSQVIAALAQMATGRTAGGSRDERARSVTLRNTTLLVLSTLFAGILGIAALPNALFGLFFFGTLSTAAAWSLSTLLPLWVARVTPSQDRGRVLGWIHLWWNAAMVAGAMTGGALVERSPSLPFLISCALCLAAIGLAIVFFRLTPSAGLNRMDTAP